MKLRPYHNPINIDSSTVPNGWRLRYADEMSTKTQRSEFWNPCSERWQKSSYGTDRWATYIVPVKS